MNIARSLVESIDELPTLPEVVARLNKLVYDPDASAADITDLISTDPALSTRLLKLVNSAFYGFDRKISSLTQAVVILGFNEVRSVAMSASILNAFQQTGSFDYRGFWIHSVGVATTAAALVARESRSEDEDGFICGLLHDVGRLILVAHGKSPYSDVIAWARQENAPLLDAETALLDANHAEVGACLLEKWQLPEKVVDAVAHHHNPGDAKVAARLAAATHAGDFAAHALQVGSDSEPHAPQLNADACRILGLGQDEILELARNERKKVDAYIENMQWDNSAS